MPGRRDPGRAGAPTPEPLPSATVALIRDGSAELEVLLLERRRRASAPDKRAPLVFPGGKVEAADGDPDREDLLELARRAAVRETQEEAGLRLEGGTLLPISRWITPAIAPKRFDTWFFLGSVERKREVVVDGSEIGAHRWLAPARALEMQRSGELSLAPPTFVTVHWLAAHERCEEAYRALSAAPLLTFRPRITTTDEGPCILYPGDAGYDSGDPHAAGPRHRLWMTARPWRYEREI